MANFTHKGTEHISYTINFISSDTFFHLWLACYIGTSRYANYVIRDLKKSDAEIFCKVLCVIDPQLTPPDFEEVYKVCGGNMFLLKKCTQNML